VTGREELPGKANYFIGNDPAKWRTDIPTYARVGYQDLYPGIDLVYYGNQRQLEYDFVVRPGADPARIVLGFEGADRLEVDTQGDLVLHTAAGAIRQRKPVIYQEAAGRRMEIAGGYALKDGRRVGFEVAAYDPDRPLVIDPVLVYSTYFGGSSGSELGFGIVADSLGNAYVTGFTNSTDLPTTRGAFRTVSDGSGDIFVAKLDPTGSALVYSTYLGGSSFDEASDIATDAVGNVYVTGKTFSTNFPTTPGAFQSARGSFVDAFVTKLNATGSALVYSTYLGGTATDEGHGIAADNLGNAYVTGVTVSADFPTTSRAFQPAFGGVADTFVTKLDPSGSVTYSTYLGGSSNDGGSRIAVDSLGNAYVTGLTSSTDFPTTATAFQTAASDQDAFVTKLNSTGTALVYSTYIGGIRTAADIAVDTIGSAYVTGDTDSTIRTTAEAFQTAPSGGFDAFAMKLNSGGSALIYSTYIGGSGSDEGHSIAVDALGNAYVTGDTDSMDFPTTPDGFQTLAGGVDAFVTKLDPTGSALRYSTYLGGSQGDHGFGIAVDDLGNVYLTGETRSTDFPVTPGAFQTSGDDLRGDAFVAKIAAAPAEQLEDLDTLIPSLGLPSGTENSLGAKVQAATDALARGDTTAACNQLDALIHQANAQSRQHPTEAAAIIARAEALRTALGCR
jgi:hypothetical protein